MRFSTDHGCPPGTLLEVHNDFAVSTIVRPSPTDAPVDERTKWHAINNGNIVIWLGESQISPDDRHLARCLTSRGERWIEVAHLRFPPGELTSI